MGILIEPKSLAFVAEGLRGEAFHWVNFVFLCDYIGEIENAEVQLDAEERSRRRKTNTQPLKQSSVGYSFIRVKG